MMLQLLVGRTGRCSRVRFWLAILAALCGPTYAKIHHSIVKSDGRTVIQLTEAFGFAGDTRGRIELKLSGSGEAVEVSDLLLS
jgi:hypothetical protein